jgi:chromosome partitioning protein
LPPSSAHIIVVGNEKGGSGKSTSAFHIIVSLLSEGARVGSIDVDSRQATLTRYVENRRQLIESKGLNLPMPRHHRVPRSQADTVAAQRQEETDLFLQSLVDLAVSHDFVVVDCPGSDSHLARIGHSYADTLVTPINDSFVDLDLLARVEPETFRVTKLSHYSELVWESRKMKALRSRGSIDWVVMRNRMSNLDAHNKRRMYDALAELEKRVGFRHLPGLSERVIFRELFPAGLTLLDLTEEGLERGMTMSHVAARQELRHVMEGLKLPARHRAAAE